MITICVYVVRLMKKLHLGPVTYVCNRCQPIQCKYSGAFHII